MKVNKFQNNPYLPELATVQEIIQETANIRTLRVSLDDKEKMREFVFRPGQVGQLSVFGAGESTFVINSPPTRKDYLQFSVMRVGEVTQRIHQLKAVAERSAQADLISGVQLVYTLGDFAGAHDAELQIILPRGRRIDDKGGLSGAEY